MNAFHEPCHLARFVIGECVKCGAVADPLHMPMKRNGWFCFRHCPVGTGTASLPIRSLMRRSLTRRSGPCERR
jgi:hypothetical protein